MGSEAADPPNTTRLEGPEWDRYQDRLRELRRNRPKNEYLHFLQEHRRLIRSVGLWIKAGPLVTGPGGRSRTVTFFVDDSAGGRVYSAPDEGKVEMEPPARVVGAGRRNTREGQASVEVRFGAGQETAAGIVQLLPFGFLRRVELSARPQPRQSAGPGEVPQRKDVRIDELATARALRDVREAAARGDKAWPGSWAMQEGGTYFLAGKTQRALELLELGEKEFDSPLCMWGQVQALRRLGRKDEASRKAAELVKKYPNSTPAQFAVEQPDELWWTPYYYSFPTVAGVAQGAYPIPQPE